MDTVWVHSIRERKNSGSESLSTRKKTQAYISSNGEYVVTSGNRDIQMVIYGKNGQLISSFYLADFNLKLYTFDSDEWQTIPHTMSGYWWIEDVICFFGPENKYFYLRFRTGENVLSP